MPVNSASAAAVAATPAECMAVNGLRKSMIFDMNSVSLTVSSRVSQRLSAISSRNSWGRYMTSIQTDSRAHSFSKADRTSGLNSVSPQRIACRICPT